MLLASQFVVKSTDAGQFDYIEGYISEAKSYIGETSKSELSESIKKNPGYADQPEEANLSAGILRSKADGKVKGEEEDKTDQEKAERQAIDAVKSSYEENPHRSRYTVTKLKNKAFIKQSDAITKNPISGLNIVGEADCKVADGKLAGENVKFEEYFIDVEDSRIKEETKKCVEDEDKLFYCERTLKAGGCVEKSDCGRDSGGIVRGSVASDMKFVYNYPDLTVGTIADNYWPGACQEYSRNTTFDVKDINMIREFRITQVGFDDYLQIKVNGSQVYNGPKGGWKLEIARERGFWGQKQIDTGNGIYSCELVTNWSFNVNIDIKPYLRVGRNTIETKVFVAGHGEGWMKIKASQYCCNRWEGDRWESDCPVS